MSITLREWMTVLHGLIFGGLCLLGFAGSLVGLLSFKPEWLTDEGARQRLRFLGLSTKLMVSTAWLAVINGTYLLHPWYHAQTAGSPEAVLLADPATALWHTLAFGWKEHVGWLAPILATSVAFVVGYYGPHLVTLPRVRGALIRLCGAAFAAAAIAGFLGAMVSRVAPIR